MADNISDALCPDDRLSGLVTALQTGEQGGTAQLAELVDAFPGDARLRFLNGSMMAARRDYADARLEMRHAVDLAPDFHIARFQLGFLALTSGEPHAAQESWGPLHGLPASHYLRHFVQGLCHLIRDEFGPATDELQRGVAANQENPPLNNDMMLILDEIRRKDADSGAGTEVMSSAQALLQQASLKSTRH